MLGDELLKGESCSGDTDAGLGGRVVGVRASKFGAFVVHRCVRRQQSCTFLADECYVVFFDGQLFSVFAGCDDDAAAARCGVNGPLNRLVRSDADCFAVASVGCDPTVSLEQASKSVRNIVPSASGRAEALTRAMRSAARMKERMMGSQSLGCLGTRRSIGYDDVNNLLAKYMKCIVRDFLY